MTEVLGSSKYVLETASLLQSLGLNALPISLGTKITGTKDFTNPEFVTNWNQWKKSDLGIGIILGGKNKLIDIDIDDPRITGICKQLLPPTPWRYGRKTKKDSHFIYSASPVASTSHILDDEALLPLKTTSFRHLPDLDRKKQDPDWKDTVLEFRADGSQSVMPGTVHEGTGEMVAWAGPRPSSLPPEIDAFQLRRTCKLIALVVLIADNAWSPGMRHEVTLCVCGMMAGAKFKVEEASTVFDQVVMFTGEGERGNILRAVKDTFKRYQEGRKIGGGPKLAELLGCRKLVDRFRQWFADNITAAFEDYDARYLALMHFGTFTVAKRDQIDDLSDPDFDTWKLADFYARTINDFIMVDTPGAKAKNGEMPKRTKILKAKIWLEERRRITYDRTYFAPGSHEEHDTRFNLWRGWGVKPNPGASCVKWLHHLKAYICGGDEALYQWSLSWCADLVQDPGKKPGTAMVLCSYEGTGKNTFITGLWKMLGMRYYREMSHAEQLTSRFNDQLQYALLIFANEATFAKDPRHHPILKAIVTDEMFQMEKKHGAARTDKNFTRLIMASNKDHVIERTTTDRRFTVMDVRSPAEDFDLDGVEKYFSELNDEIDGDGPAALLAYLMDHKYRKWDIRRPYVTEAARRQTRLSLPQSMQFWSQCLNDGRIAVREEDEGGLPSAGSKQDWHEPGWPKWISKKALEETYLHSKFHRREGSFEFWTEFYKLSGVSNKTIKRTLMEGRKNTVTLPPLDECIELMNQRCPGSVAVPGEGDTVQEEEIGDEI